MSKKRIKMYGAYLKLDEPFWKYVHTVKKTSGNLWQLVNITGNS